LRRQLPATADEPLSTDKMQAVKAGLHKKKKKRTKYFFVLRMIYKKIVFLPY
jgi:hypothetical protein